MKNFDELIQFVQKNPQKKKVAVAAAHDEHTLEGINRAYENGIAVPILIGDQTKIESIMKKEGLSFPEAEVVDSGDDTAAARSAVRMVREGKADFIMKGKLQTADLLKEVVNKEHGLQTGGIMSHFGIFEIPGYPKLMVLTDGGMLPYPNAEQKAQILMNAVRILHTLGCREPKVAVLAAAETVNPKIQETVDGALLKKMNEEGTLGGCIVEGPISYDLMISPEAAAIKGYSSPVTGDTDILLMPNMTSGNLLAKAFQFTAGAKMAGMITGAGAPIVLVSRGATAEEKYLSLVLSAASAQKKKFD